MSMFENEKGSLPVRSYMVDNDFSGVNEFAQPNLVVDEVLMIVRANWLSC